MMEKKAVIGETDMLQVMQQDALRFAGKALDQYDVTDSTEIAHLIKKEFDRSAVWTGVAVHQSGCFIYFTIGTLSILLFRGAVASEEETGRQIAMEPDQP